jgi:hypothetical protein
MSGSFTNFSAKRRTSNCPTEAYWMRRARRDLGYVKDVLGGAIQEKPHKPIIGALFNFNSIRMADEELMDKGREPNGRYDKPFRSHDPRDRFAEYRCLEHHIIKGTYKPFKPTTIDIEKLPAEEIAALHPEPGTDLYSQCYRTLRIPSYRDALVLHILNKVLTPVLDPALDDRMYGFRPGRGVNNALASSIHHIDAGNTYVLTRDIRKAFDNIRHVDAIESLEMAQLPTPLIKLIKKTLRLKPGNIGIPQGAAISPLILNLVLNTYILDKLPDIKAKVIAYADDITIIARNRNEAYKASDAIESLLQNIGLKYHPNKKHSADLNIGNSVKILGYTITKKGGKIHVDISESKWADIYDTLHKEGIEDVLEETVIGLLNAIGPILFNNDNNDTINTIINRINNNLTYYGDHIELESIIYGGNDKAKDILYASVTRLNTIIDDNKSNDIRQDNTGNTDTTDIIEYTLKTIEYEDINDIMINPNGNNNIPERTVIDNTLYTEYYPITNTNAKDLLRDFNNKYQIITKTNKHIHDIYNNFAHRSADGQISATFVPISGTLGVNIQRENNPHLDLRRWDSSTVRRHIPSTIGTSGIIIQPIPYLTNRGPPDDARIDMSKIWTSNTT